MKLLRMCRSVLRELKAARGEREAKEQWRYIVSTVRLRQTGREDSREGARAISTLASYLTYLQSSRRHRELLERYQGRGERSIEETARLVGLSLPEHGTETTSRNGTETHEQAAS